MAISDRLKVMLVTDSEQEAMELTDSVRKALRGGVGAVMLREKKMATRPLYELAGELRRLTHETGALLIINDRLDVALAVGADGVHLGWLSLPVLKVREMIGERLIGVSTHSTDEVKKAEDEGADYVTFGPVFPTPSKEGLVKAKGIAGVRQASSRVTRIPVLGIGGINITNAREVVEAGAAGVAVIRSILAAPDPEEAARGLVNIVSKHSED